MIKIVLIRHSKTEGNLQGRYIGTTDEHLCNEGVLLVKSKEFPESEIIYCSPMLRCIETAELIYSNLQPVIIDDLRECNFGDFENKNYKELNGNEDYQKWINSNGTLPFPNGENTEEFKKRSIDAFDKIVEDVFNKKIKNSSIVVHGGTIMSILDKYSYPNKEFYCWQVSNCCGYLIEIDEKLWMKSEKRIRIISKI